MTDFYEHLRRQRDFLARSASAYDAGLRDEAYRIAVAIRVLLHDTKYSTSILEHLMAKGVPVLSTTIPAAPRAVFYDGLSLIGVGAGNTAIIPALDRSPIRRFVRARDWWTEVVFVLEDLKLSRENIVLRAANQDGGAHVDKNLDADYAQFKSGIWTFVSDAPTFADVPEPQLIFLRQMAYEILNSPALDDLATRGAIRPENQGLSPDIPRFEPPRVDASAMESMTRKEVERLRTIVRYGHVTLLDGLSKSSLGAATNPLGNFQIDQQKGFLGSLDDWLALLLAEGLVERSTVPDLVTSTMRGRAFVARIVEIGH